MVSLEEQYNGLKGNKYFNYFNVKAQYDMKDLSREKMIRFFKEESEKNKSFMNKYENPFMSIKNFEEKMIDYFVKEDDIVIQEKIDGSNSHLVVTSDGFTCYSNNYELNDVNNLQGYYFWCKDNYMDVPKEYYGLEIYGEWLVPHHCIYPWERYGQFYVFDVMKDGEYLPWCEVKKIADNCGFCTVPLLYEGKFQSWKHVVSLVGKTEMGGFKGEGVVLKNQSKLNSDRGNFYVKIVDVEFQETNRSRQVIKYVDMNKVVAREEQAELSRSIVTLPRVRKIIYKLVDDGELMSSWKDLKIVDIVRVVKPYVFKDCLKEEKEMVDKVGGVFGKYCNEYVTECVKDLLNE